MSKPVSSAEFGGDGDENLGASGKIGGEVEGSGGGERDCACGGFWPGGVARPWSPSGGFGRSQGGRIQDFRSDQRHGSRPAQPKGDDPCRTPRAQKSEVGRWGVRVGAERQGGSLCGRRNRVALSCASLQAGREAVRVHRARSSRAAASVIRPGSRLGGRSASHRAIATGGSRRAEPGVAGGEAQVAQRGFVGVDPQDPGARPRRSAAPGERASAPAAGGSARKMRRAKRPSPAPAAEQRDRPPLPFPLARAQAGIGAGAGKSLALLRGFRLSRCAFACARPPPNGAGARPRRGRSAVVEQFEISANHLAMVHAPRRFVSSFRKLSAPLVVGRRCPIRFHYRT